MILAVPVLHLIFMHNRKENELCRCISSQCFFLFTTLYGLFTGSFPPPPGTPTPASINGGPPSMLSPTAVASFSVPPTNGAAEIYANGIPHYTGTPHLSGLGLSSEVVAHIELSKDCKVQAEVLWRWRDDEMGQQWLEPQLDVARAGRNAGGGDGVHKISDVYVSNRKITTSPLKWQGGGAAFVAIS